MAVDSKGGTVEAAQADSANLTTKYLAVAITTTAVTIRGVSHQVDLPAAGARIDGILVEETDAVDKVVHYDRGVGTRQIGVAGAAISTPGVLLVATAAGKLIPSSSGTSGDAIVGKSLEIASGDGSRFAFVMGNYGTV